jgi:Pyruvate/2-oxoacid:ferredoxin oxidoreductase delta subunit
MKTHSYTRMTGAVKNQYGCIPGFLKKIYHIRLPNSFDFSRLLVALNLCLKPRLYVMDAIRAMEGNGPNGGDPFVLGCLLFSTDPVALDAVMCTLVELDPLYVPTMSAGRDRGLGTYLMDEIETVGDAIGPLVNGDFRVKRGPIRDISVTGVLAVINNLIADRPVIDAGRCNLCGECIESCAANPKAIAWRIGKRRVPPAYHYLRCTRCYCCQETCSEGAISVKNTILRLNR